MSTQEDRKVWREAADRTLNYLATRNFPSERDLASTVVVLVNEVEQLEVLLTGARDFNGKYMASYGDTVQKTLSVVRTRLAEWEASNDGMEVLAAIALIDTELGK